MDELKAYLNYREAVLGPANATTPTVDIWVTVHRAFARAMVRAYPLVTNPGALLFLEWSHG